MSASRYDWHYSFLGAPTLISAMLFGLALDSWWLSVFLSFVSLALFILPYRLYFSISEGHPRRRDIGANALFVFVQIIFWGIAFVLLREFKHVPTI